MAKHWDTTEYQGMPSGEDLHITDVNLARLDPPLTAIAESRAAFLEEKVRSFTNAVTNEYPEDIIERLIRDERFPETFRELSRRSPVIPEGTLSVEDAVRTLALTVHEEQITLCRMLAHANDKLYYITDLSQDSHWTRMLSDLVREEDHIDDETAPDLDVRVPRPGGERIAYLRNTYTDIAYEQFARVLRHASPTYYSDFPGVCEALYYDHASACILPMENSTDGKLLRFYTLLNKYDLRIAYTCSVTQEDTDVTTRYALLRKTISVPRPEETDHDGLFLECRVITDESATLVNLLTAADAYRLMPTRVDSIPMSYDDGRQTFDLVFAAAEQSDLGAMLTYLYLLFPQFTLFGIYLSV